MKRCVAIASVALLTSCAGIRPPQTFPDVDAEASRDAVVVARTYRGDYLPQFPECQDPDVICMDPPPFWFRARVMDVVFGSIERASIVAATTSHYGMESFGLGDEPSLLRLAVDGDAAVMPRYARASLRANRRGELFVTLNRPSPIWWLPCSVMEVAVEIDADEFVEDLLIPSMYVSEDEIAEGSDFLERTEGGFLPRKAIPVSGLEQHLRSRYPGQKLPECEKE